MGHTDTPLDSFFTRSCWMVATLLASSLLILLHLGGWPVCWASWLPPWHAAFAVNAAKPNLTMRRTCSRSLQWSLDNPHETRFKCSQCFSVLLHPFPSLMSIRNFPCRDGIMQWHRSRILCLMHFRWIVNFLLVWSWCLRTTGRATSESRDWTFDSAVRCSVWPGWVLK